MAKLVDVMLTEYKIKEIGLKIIRKRKKLKNFRPSSFGQFL